MFHYLYMTNNPDVAVIAEKNGVDRIWLDLEKNGKKDRQRGFDSVISNHTLQDVYNVRDKITEAKLLVRVNPWFEGSRREIDEVIKAGADIIMLPMWKTKEEVERFYEAVGNRANTILLLETREAAETAVDEVMEFGLAEEIHLGLRDLSISYGIDFLFSIYEGDILEKISAKIRSKSVPFGIGGIGKFGVGFSPGPERLLVENIRLGATSVILSRTFCNSTSIKTMDELEQSFSLGMKEVKKWNRIAKRMPQEVFDYNRKELIYELKGN